VLFYFAAEIYQDVLGAHIVLVVSIGSTSVVSPFEPCCALANALKREHFGARDRELEHN
jgi:hypothetical protein